MDNLKHALLLIAILLTSCVEQKPKDDGKDITVGSEWQDIGVPTSINNSYTILKVEDGYVYDIGTNKVIHRIPVADFKKFCYPKQ